jgi:hypothetical protein
MARYIFTQAFETAFIKKCSEAKSMSAAALQLGMNYKTLCFHAKRLGCFKANQSGKGYSKRFKGEIIPIEKILDGSHKTFQSHKLKKRLLKEGFKSHKCESCGLTEWLSKPIPLELHHIDGNQYNNILSNLKLVCLNCHALTDNYRARNIKKLSASAEMRIVEPLKFGETFR